MNMNIDNFLLFPFFRTKNIIGATISPLLSGLKEPEIFTELGGMVKRKTKQKINNNYCYCDKIIL